MGVSTHGWKSIAALALVLCLGAATGARAQSSDGARYALLVQGASGEEQYATLHRGWVDQLSGLLRDQFKYDAAHLTVLVEQPKTGEERATAENVRAVLGRLATRMAPADQLVVLFVGHGGGEASDAKFNLVGPDLTVAQWKELLQPIKGRIALVNTTSASFPYLAGLSAPGRVIITATSTNAQRFHTVFPNGFVQAFKDATADLDKDGRISLLEAFTYASRMVKQYYEQKGTMATEVAALDDTGDGKGRDAVATGPDGKIAALVYLEPLGGATSTDPETARLLARQQALTEQLAALRQRQASMPAADFEREFEALVTELATVSQQVRQRTGR